ncbi:high mobility group box-domain-containing protein [Baffinella frigidus]|nr:high mobility group box-domain-containing protein [Cryptophyta sp. CCMP2293]|eukprot:CAMPEP_0180135604 /NCGR_PEP_ID=MMETSP0986-20121125/10943_1 /TAXON_ID=697907 /ORGANISM="non described non described, Strain CCMP2293" /LENGTH=371 /DNA_ID=CAMNT_0022076361 /DNA_START=90 /DNA_END=1205 /DNA_ORIENTATION=-
MAAVASAGKVKVYGPDNESFVKCDCCDETAPASMWYNKTKVCAKGGPSESFIAKFKVIEVPGKAGKKGSAGRPKAKKDAEASSNANTPTKDAANSEEDGSEEVEKPAAKKAKKETKEPKEPKEAKEPKSAKKEKKADNGEPKQKRTLSAYMLWTMERREEFKAANDGKNPTMSELGAEWKLMSEEDQKVWKDQADANKEAAGPSESSIKNAAKAKAKAEGPRKARSGYFIYMAEQRETIKEEMPGIAPKEIMVTIGARWKGLSKAEQLLWNDKAAAEKAEIEAEKKAGDKRKSSEPAEEAAEAEEETEEAADKKDSEEEDKDEEESKEEEGKDAEMKEAESKAEAAEEEEEVATSTQEPAAEKEEEAKADE